VAAGGGGLLYHVYNNLVPGTLIFASGTGGNPGGTPDGGGFTGLSGTAGGTGVGPKYNAMLETMNRNGAAAVASASWTAAVLCRFRARDKGVSPGYCKILMRT